MAAPSNFIRSLLRWTLAQDDDRDALEALVIAGADAITASGKELTSASANGKAYSYTIPPNMSAMEVLEAMEEALTLFDSIGTTADVTAYLAIRPPSRTVSRGIGYFDPYAATQSF